LLRASVIPIAPARNESVSQGLSRPLEAAFLARQAVQNLPLPALFDALDPDRRDVDRHSVLEPGAQESMHVRVRRAILSTMLMDRKHALGAPRRATESLLDGIAQDALREMPVEPLEALRRRVVHCQDEAEVDRVS
jgi:hypothetical protein